MKSSNLSVMLLALAAAAMSSTARGAIRPGMTREQVVKELGIGRPSGKLTPEERREGYVALTKGDPRDKTIALTFDDGPHGPITNKLVDVLAEYHVPATFFVVGEMAEKHPDNIRYEAQSGNLVEDHTYTHPCLDALTEPQVVDEYLRCATVIEQLTGKAPRYCRPPGGDFDDKVLQAAKQLNLVTTLWTDDPGDYKRLPVATIEDQVLRTAHPGGIILLHDGIQQTIDAMPKIINTLRAEGYRFVRVDELQTENLQAKVRHTLVR